MGMITDNIMLAEDDIVLVDEIVVGETITKDKIGIDPRMKLEDLLDPRMKLEDLLDPRMKLEW